MADTFFKDINIFVPNLRHFSNKKVYLTEVLVEYMAKLSELKTLIIGNECKEQEFNPILSYKLFRYCARLKSVYLWKSYFLGNFFKFEIERKLFRRNHPD